MGTAHRMAGKMAGRRSERMLGIAALVAMAVSLVLSLGIAPPDAEQGDVQRLMYVHVPAAWLAYLAFAVVFVASIAYLRGRRTRWDRLASASAEVGVLFTALAIVLGSLWGKPVWGVWWTWDPRLVTTAVLLLIYTAYLAVHRLPDDPARGARWAAVLGIVGFLDVPIVHLSVVWWRSLHQGPTVVRLGGPTIEGTMLAALLVGVAAFTLLYAYLVTLRMRVGRAEAAARTAALAPLPAAEEPARG